MSDIVLKWVGWKQGYEGRPGWPAKDLTQEELDRRGLDKAEMLAYHPKLYEEARPEKVEGKREGKKSGRSHRRTNTSVQPGESADVYEGDDDDGSGADSGIHPGGGGPGEDRPDAGDDHSPIYGNDQAAVYSSTDD